MTDDIDDLDLTPDPRVLVALTHTPLQPLDALCELIDNAIDSFNWGRKHGSPTTFPMVIVEVPGKSETDRGEGLVRVRDNGPGLSRELTEQALKAGFSGKQKSGDTLGLFGMGFNIASGKLGRETRFVTARKSDEQALSVHVDLVAMQQAANYKVPAEYVEKPDGLEHGTVVEVSGWWPEGNPNSGFIRKLAGFNKSQLRRSLGHRYATLLRGEDLRIVVNQEPVQAYEHCVWDASRFVERREHGRIPARFDLDEVIFHETRCADCDGVVPEGSTACPTCGQSHLITKEERIRGWVGVQRFDDQQDFGIDLIRNGRAIRTTEKAAFFEFTDDLGRTTKDYPIDSPYGRLVGEIHLDHVPVDFLKQDFQRSSEEWRRAMIRLRGESSLQPNQPNAGTNTSPVFKLYQGYRRVRNPGRRDMYMGYWPAGSDKAKRISRDVETEMYEKFLARDPGFFDDSEWWKLVEQADRRPLESLAECPECGAENLADLEVCQACQHVLVGRECVNADCKETIPASAATCPHCGTSQVVEVESSWKCNVCQHENGPGTEACSECGGPQGAADPASLEALRANSDKDDELSVPGCSIPLPDGEHSPPIDVEVSIVRGDLRGWYQGPRLPVVVFKSETIELFLDTGHPLFRQLGVRPETIVATEVAQYLYDLNRRYLTSGGQEKAHTVSNLAFQIAESEWSEQLEDGPLKVRKDIESLFESAREVLPRLFKGMSEEIFDDLTESGESSVIANILAQGGSLDQARASGDYLRLVSDDSVVSLFRRFPERFFDSGLWPIEYQGVAGLGESGLADYQGQVRGAYLNCLEDCISYLRYKQPEEILTSRARASVDFLTQHLA